MKGSRHTEKAVWVVLLVLSTAGFLPLLSREGPSIFATDFARLAWLGVYIALAIMLLSRLDRVTSSAREIAPAVGVVLLALLSTGWSAQPGQTGISALTLAGTTALAAVLSRRFSLDELVEIVAAALGVVVVASSILALAMPQLGLDHLRNDAWRGIFLTKNELGRAAVLALIFLATVALTRRRLVAVGLFVAALACLLRSESRTGFFVGAVILFVALLIPLLRANYLVATASAFLVGGAAMILSFITAPSLDRVATFYGADATLTGRTEIWEAVVPSIRERPWLGWGYDAFWSGQHPPAEAVWQRVGPVVHSHNAALDVAAQLGLVGLALLAAAIAVVSARGWLAMRGGSLLHAVPLLLLIFLVLYGVTEGSFVTHNSIYWILFVAVGMHREVLVSAPEHRRTKPAPDSAPAFS